MKIILFKFFDIYLFFLIVTLFSFQSIQGGFIDPDGKTVTLIKNSNGRYDIFQNKDKKGSISPENIAKVFKRLNYFDFSIYVPDDTIIPEFHLAEAYIDGWIIPAHLPMIILLFNTDFIFNQPVATLFFSIPQIIYSYLKYHKTKELLTRYPGSYHHEVGMFLSACTATSPILGAGVEWFLRKRKKKMLLSSHIFKVLDQTCTLDRLINNK